MTIHIERSALMSYSAHQMYLLVNDVEKYPEFLPWCTETQLISSTDTEMVAKLIISKGPIRQYFITRNNLVADKSVELNLQEGPFKKLHGLWTFNQLSSEACRIQLVMDFDYSNVIIKAALGPLFNKAATTMVEVFCQRAKQIYG
ncbi:type II toxin-antitoxin system RatA family toxin [Entomomonas moraniae]|uniref:Type II toxin-antitoxin system RatA family toxin n=1 Tax=Entomomonas moraniae TaxID=2213226 RepID=A0A3Q9JJS5_9GAMM|nr:type II toxin-antitoxin system RatA family toxin [Entomomonas moraniae]AZS51212.1 type II toxin-antitoxin system RatA family toxin [Entomomonas moraniae]